MRLIGSLPTEPEADRFSSWLLTRSIECQVDRSDGNGFEVWVKDEDQFVAGKSELMAFRENPTAEKYRSAVTEAKKIQQERIKQRNQFQKNVQTGPAQQRGIFESAPLTMVMVLICVIVAVFSDFGSKEKEDRFVARALQFVSVDAPNDELKELALTDRDNLDLRLASIYQGELWRSVSPIFYHYDTFHVIFNLYWLVYLGRMIEMRYGTLRLAMIVVFSAIFSNVLQCVVPIDVGGSAPYLLPTNLLVSKFGGMSGVNYALFGFIWMRMLYDPSSRLQLPQFTVFLLIAYLFYCMIRPEVQGASVANWAHGGGFVMGMLLGLSPIGKLFGKPR